MSGVEWGGWWLEDLGMLNGALKRMPRSLATIISGRLLRVGWSEVRAGWGGREGMGREMERGVTAGSSL